MIFLSPLKPVEVQGSGQHKFLKSPQTFPHQVGKVGNIVVQDLPAGTSAKPGHPAGSQPPNWRRFLISGKKGRNFFH